MFYWLLFSTATGECGTSPLGDGDSEIANVHAIGMALTFVGYNRIEIQS